MRSTTRKLQQVGGGTYTVSVPKDWATDHGLTAGTQIHLYRHVDGSLVVRGSEDGSNVLADARIDLAEPTVADLERALRTAHAIGFERVTLASTAEFTDDHHRAMASAARTLVGFEVVEESASTVTLQNVVDATNVSIRQSLTQLQYVAVSMLQSGVDALLGDERAAAQLADRDAEVQRLFGVVERHCNRSLVSFQELSNLDVRRAELFDYYEVARHLTRVGTHATALASLGRRSDASIPDDLATALSPVADHVGESVEHAASALLATPGPSAERAGEALGRSRAALDDVATLQEQVFTSSSPGVAVVATALASLARTGEHGRAIAEIAHRAGHRPDED